MGNTQSNPTQVPVTLQVSLTVECRDFNIEFPVTDWYTSLLIETALTPDARHVNNQALLLERPILGQAGRVVDMTFIQFICMRCTSTKCSCLSVSAVC